jgi:hypothetical protein
MGTKGNNNVVKCKVNFALEQAIKAQRERDSRGVIYYFFNLGAKWGRVVNATFRLFYTRERDPVPIV